MRLKDPARWRCPVSALLFALMAALGKMAIAGIAPTGIGTAAVTTEGGIMEMPAPIHHSNAMLIDPKTDEPTRVRRRKDKDGTIERIAVKSGGSIPRNR